MSGSSKVSVLALALALVFFSAGAMARWQINWVAFATHENGAFGVAWGAPNSADAAAQAIAQCGFEKCQLGRVFPARCIAVAGSNRSSARGFGSGDSDESAMRLAYEWCEKSAAERTCHIEAVRCAP